MSFEYLSANKTSEVKCNLQCQRCSAMNKNGKQCERNTCKQLPYCYQHSKIKLGVEIKQSTIPKSGFGLFALRPFRKKEIIAPYEGLTRDQSQADKMYGTAKNDVAPYMVKTAQDQFRDSACKRGVASFSNNQPGKNNSSLAINQTNKTVNLKATKNISKGAEIFAAYGKHYFPRPNNLPKPMFKTNTSKRKLETEVPMPKKK